MPKTARAGIGLASLIPQFIHPNAKENGRMRGPLGKALSPKVRSRISQFQREVIAEKIEAIKSDPSKLKLLDVVIYVKCPRRRGILRLLSECRRCRWFVEYEKGANVSCAYDPYWRWDGNLVNCSECIFIGPKVLMQGKKWKYPINTCSKTGRRVRGRRLRRCAFFMDKNGREEPSGNNLKIPAEAAFFKKGERGKV